MRYIGPKFKTLDGANKRADSENALQAKPARWIHNVTLRKDGTYRVTRHALGESHTMLEREV